MPCVHHMKNDHRERLGNSFVGDVFRCALVSRPVGRKEMLSDPEAPRINDEGMERTMDCRSV